MGVSHSRVLHRSLRETPPKAVGGDGVWLIAEDGRRFSTAPVAPPFPASDISIRA